jgi:hypothetical protein
VTVRTTRLLVLLGWTAFAVAVQRWFSIADGIRLQFAADSGFYRAIARAAPGFVDEAVLRAYAQRFAPHWLVGVVADATGLSLEAVYRAATVLVLAGALLLLHATLVRIGLEARPYALAVGVLAASAYPLHYLLAAPGMLSDAVFVLGLTALLFGVVRGSLSLALVGIAVATLGRQTALPVGLAAAVWTAVDPAWRTRRTVAAVSLVAVPVGLYAVLHLASDGFSAPRPADFDDLTVVGFFTSLHSIAEHVGLVLLGIAVPAALVAGAWVRSRVLAVGPLLVAAAIVAQPLLLGPLANRSNEPRLAALAVPALVVAAGLMLRGVRLGLAETLVVAAAIAVAGLHHRYTWAGIGPNTAWAAVDFAAAGVVLLVLAAPVLVSRGSPRRSVSEP